MYTDALSPHNLLLSERHMDRRAVRPWCRCVPCRVLVGA